MTNPRSSDETRRDSSSPTAQQAGLPLPWQPSVFQITGAAALIFFAMWVDQLRPIFNGSGWGFVITMLSCVAGLLLAATAATRLILSGLSARFPRVSPYWVIGILVIAASAALADIIGLIVAYLK